MHPNCDEQLQQEIQSWVDSQGAGGWSRQIQAAIIANVNIDPEKLIKHGIETENTVELWEVKHHEKLIPEIETKILTGRGWHSWPSDEYLETFPYIFSDSEDLEEIQIDPDAYY